MLIIILRTIGKKHTIITRKKKKESYFKQINWWTQETYNSSLWWNTAAVIQEAVSDLIQSVGYKRKARVAEFMKDECNLSIKAVVRHPVNLFSLYQKRRANKGFWWL